MQAIKCDDCQRVILEKEKFVSVDVAKGTQNTSMSHSFHRDYCMECYEGVKNETNLEKDD